MVRLKTAAGHHHTCAAVYCVGEQELELSDLVARLGAGGRVVALQPDVRADDLVERVEPHDGRRPVNEEQSRDGSETTSQLHASVMSFPFASTVAPSTT